MKDYLIFSILLYIVKNKSTTAKEIAKNFDISQRTVYRYIDSLSLIGVPIITKLGRTGGIELVRDYYIDGLMLSKNDKNIIKKYIKEGNLPEDLLKVLNKL